MKIKITASCIINTKDHNENHQTFVEGLRENNAEAAFEQLQETGSSGTCNFKCEVEELES